MPLRELPAAEAALYKGLEDTQHGLDIEVQKVTHPSFFAAVFFLGAPRYRDG